MQEKKHFYYRIQACMKKGENEKKKLVKYGSEEKSSSLCKCSILLGSLMSKKLDNLSEDKITNILGFLTW